MMLKRTIATAMLCLCLAAFSLPHAYSAQEQIGKSMPVPTDIVVFLPGFLGTKLQDRNGRVVWGNAPKTLARFDELELSSQQPPLLVPGEILDSVAILGPLKVDKYSGLLDTLGSFGYVRNRNLFVFPYDWRQSNFDTAIKLKDFIENNRAFTGKKITIIAHSMGGIVATIYIQKHGGSKHVKRLITLGTPFYGSPVALRIFFEGLDNDFGNKLVGGKKKAIQVLSSFPSTYELLPNYENNCADFQKKEVNVTRIDVWKRCNWLFSDMPHRIPLVEQSLERARELQKLVRQPFPEDVSGVKIVGTLINTYFKLYLGPDCMPDRWVLLQGDGTVPLVSAIAGNQDTSQVAIHQHSTIFNDKGVREHLKLLLTREEAWRNVAATQLAGIVIKSDGTTTNISGIDIDNRTPFLRPGDQATINITVFFQDEQAKAHPVSGIDIKGWLIKESGPFVPVPVAETNGVYSATVKMPFAPGAYTIRLDVPGLRSFEEYVIVVDE